MAFQFFLPLLSYPDPAPATGLMHALDFAATLGGKIRSAEQVVDVPPITNPLATAMLDTKSMAAAAEELSRGRAEHLAQQATSLAKRLATPITSEQVVCRPEATGEILAEQARTCDFTLLPFDGESGHHHAVAEALIFGSGGPVVLFPDTETATHLEVVAISWDGSTAAARAVRDALPILRLAKQVLIVTVRSEKNVSDSHVEALRAFLSGHDIDARHVDQPLGDGPIGQALQHRALDEDAGLMVMGGYGHSRLREFVLGGATRSALASMRLPVLMSH